jgi:hypothetical protein
VGRGTGFEKTIPPRPIPLTPFPAGKGEQIVGSKLFPSGKGEQIVRSKLFPSGKGNQIVGSNHFPELEGEPDAKGETLFT